MTYGDFRFRAEVDWIGIEIETAKPTNFMTIRRAIKAPYVEAADEGPGRSANIFRFRLQDPGNIGSMQAELNRLQDKFGFASIPLVYAIEVSFDAYSKSQDAGALALLTANLFKFNASMPSLNRRFAGERKGQTEGVGSTFDHIKKRIAEGGELVVGNQSSDRNGRWNADSISQRYYLKTTDQGGEPLVSREKHRARAEVTLQGEGLPYTSLAEWSTFPFHSLTKYFRFRKCKEMTPELRALMDRAVQIGERIEPGAVPGRTRNRKGGGTRLFNRLTTADLELNGKVRDALRELSRRWSAI